MTQLPYSSSHSLSQDWPNHSHPEAALHGEREEEQQQEREAHMFALPENLQTYLDRRESRM